MADIDPRLLQSLVNELGNLVKHLKIESLNQGDRDRSTRNRKTTRRTRSGFISTEAVINDFEKLARSVRHTVKTYEESRDTIRRTKEDLRDLVTPTTNLNRVFRNTAREFDNYVKAQNETYQKVSKNTLDAFQKIWTSGGKVDDVLRDVSDIHVHFNKNYKKAMAALNEAGAIDDVKNRRKSLEAQKEDKIVELRGVPETENKKRDSIIRDIKNLAHSIKEHKKEETRLDGLEAKTAKELDAFFITLQDISKKYGVNVLEGINKHEFDVNFLKKRSPEEIGKLVKKLRENINAVSDGVSGFERSVHEYRTVVVNARKQLWNSVKAMGASLIFSGGNRLIEDYLAMRKHHIESWMPTQAGYLGMSTGELATLVGENRNLARMMGGGTDELAIFQDATLKTTFKDLQNSAKMFGVVGNEAAELAMAFAKFNIEVGTAAAPALVMAQMEQFKILEQTTGETSETLMDFYRNMSETGELARMNAAYADRTEDERVRKISEEVSHRVKLNKQLGYNIEHLRQQNALIVSQRYAGIAETVKAALAMDLVVNEFNKANPENRIDDVSIQFLKATQGARQALMLEDREAYDRGMANLRRVQLYQQSRLTDIEEEGAKGILAGRYNVMYGATTRVMQQIYAMNPDLTPERLEEVRKAHETAKAQDANYITNILENLGFSSFFGRFRGRAADEITVSEIGRSSDSTTDNFMKLGEAASDLREKFIGLGKSIPGSGASGAAAMNLLSSIFNLIILRRVGRGFPRKLSGIFGNKTGSAGGRPPPGTGTSAIGRGLGGRLGIMAAGLPLATGGLMAINASKEAAINTADVIGTMLPMLLAKNLPQLFAAEFAWIAGSWIGNRVREAVESSERARNIERVNEAKHGFGTLKGEMSAFYEKYIEPFSNPVQSAIKTRIYNSDDFKKHASIVNAYKSDMMGRFQGSFADVGFGGALQADANIVAGIIEGKIQESDLRTIGASREYLQRVRELQKNYENAIKDGDVELETLSDVDKAILEMAANIAKMREEQNMERKEQKEKNHFQRSTQERAAEKFNAALAASSALKGNTLSFAGSIPT